MPDQNDNGATSGTMFARISELYEANAVLAAEAKAAARLIDLQDTVLKFERTRLAALTSENATLLAEIALLKSHLSPQ